MAIAIVTDAAAAMPPQLIKKYHIHVVPFQLLWAGETLRDGIDITPTQFYQRLRKARQLPTTSQPAVGDLVELYNDLGRRVEGIVSIHIAKEFTGTYNTALTAANMLEGVPIEVIDSRNAAMAQGFVVLEAARAASQGATISQVAERATAVVPKVHLFATLDTLEYLRRGGRVNDIVALLGSVLRIKPVLHLYDGHIRLLAEARSKARAMEIMINAMDLKVGGNRPHIAVVHADAPQEAERLMEMVKAHFDCSELHCAEFSPVMGAHTGPGVLGLAFYA